MIGDNATKIDQIFIGKVVLVYLINSSDAFAGGIAISDPKIEKFNGRTFVTGIVPSGLHDWSAGQRIGVGFEQIAHYLEFANEQEFMEKSAFAIQDKGATLPT